MIKGKPKIDDAHVDTLLAATNKGYDVFKYYLGNVGKCMYRPWGRKERDPSWGIFPGDVWFYRDFATGETGNAIHFVGKYFCLDFVQAIRKIEYDFGFGGEEISATPVKVTWETPDMKKEYAEINIIDMPFAKRHHDFWNIAEVSEEHCKRMNTYAVKSLAINKKRMSIGDDEAVFAYYCPEEIGYKIYFPERREKKFKNNVTNLYLWNFSNLERCEDLIIQKSNKDMNVTTMITPCVTATQNESHGIFTEDIVSRINSITPSPWIWYGADRQGVEASTTITGTNCWKYINTPKEFLPDVNDVYGFVKMHNLQKMGTGLKELEKFMKEKKLIT